MGLFKAKSDVCPYLPIISHVGSFSMTDARSMLVSILAVAGYGAKCFGSAVVKEPLVAGLWTAVLALGGGMMLFLITIPHVPTVA